MTVLKSGDKVRYKGGDGNGLSNPQYVGVEGTIIEATGGNFGNRVKVTKSTVASENSGLIVGSEFFPRGTNLELIESGKPFKVGDKVTVQGYAKVYPRHTGWDGRTGTIDRVWDGWASVTFDDVDTDSIKGRGGFDYQYLVPVKPFTFTDIQVGDKIKRTRNHKDGTEEIVTGTVDSKGTMTAYSDNSVALAFSVDDSKEDITLELLDRPAQEPKLWENRQPGDKIVRKDKDDGALTVFIKEDEENWSSIYLNNECDRTPEKGYDWTTEELRGAFNGYDLSLIKK